MTNSNFHKYFLFHTIHTHMSCLWFEMQIVWWRNKSLNVIHQQRGWERIQISCTIDRSWKRVKDLYASREWKIFKNIFFKKHHTLLVHSSQEIKWVLRVFLGRFHSYFIRNFNFNLPLFSLRICLWSSRWYWTLL